MAIGAMGKMIAKRAFGSTAAKINTGMSVVGGISTFNESREEGGSVIGSALEAAVDVGIGAFAGLGGNLLYMGVQAAPAIGGAIYDAYNAVDMYGRRLQKQRRNTPFQNATFVDSQQTYTMRQAGMNLARQGQYAAQQTTLGNEAASVMYMGR